MKTDQVWLAASAAFVESHVGSALTDPNVNEWQPLCFVFFFSIQLSLLLVAGQQWTTEPQKGKKFPAGEASGGQR